MPSLAPASTAPVLITVLPALPIEEMRRFVREPAGEWTVADVVDATGIAPEACFVSLDGRPVAPEDWASTRPMSGQSLIVAHRPGGVGFVWAVAGAAKGWAAVAAYAVAVAYTIAVSYGLTALTRALTPVESHDVDAVAGGGRRTISGSRNAFEAYGTVPQVLGKHRLFPPLAARSYTIEEDGALYQYSLFTFGYGPLVLSDLKIADEPLFRESTTISYLATMESDSDRFVGENGNPVVELQLRAGTPTDAAITLFAADVQEMIIGHRLRESRGWFRQRTLERATRITVIIGCPNGLIWRTDTGKTKERTVRISVRYRAVGATSWTHLTRIQMTAKTLSTVFASRSWNVSEGSYEVECQRETEEGLAAGISDRTDWMTMLVQRAGEPVLEPELCLVAMRAKITGQFENVIDQFNAVAQTYAPAWNGSTWANAATSDPAALFRHVLQGNANKRPLADAGINLTALAAWSEECSTEGFEFNFVTQGRSTVPDVLRQITTAGRASVAVQDGLLSVVRENDLSGAPVQHLTPRNVRSFRSERSYISIPHALRVQFVDPDSGYLDTERIVYDDGYSKSNATVFERLDLAGITSSDQAWKLGRTHLAQLRLRPEAFIYEMDHEWMDLRRGDWCKTAHDVILVGLAQGRVVSVTQNGGGDATAVTLDQQCPMAAASYAVRFRKSDGSSVYAAVTTVAGNQTTLTFTTPIDSADPQPVAGDLFLFGEAGVESIDVIVKDLAPGQWPNAAITCMDAAPAVLTAADGTIPRYDPQITIPPVINPNLIVPANQAPRRSARIAAITSSDVRDIDGRGPIIRRGLRVRLLPSGVQVQ